MSLTILLAGASGYIGGDILHEIIAAFSSARITTLVRDKDRARNIIEKYSQVTLLEGDLGEGRWGNVHIADLSRLIVSLIQASMEKKCQEGLWNEDGVYRTGTGGITWKEIAERVFQAAEENGVKAKVESVDAKEADDLFPHDSVLFGTNARGRPGLAEKLLGYQARENSLEVEIPIMFWKEFGGSKS